jgi:hypothetical protein
MEGVEKPVIAAHLWKEKQSMNWKASIKQARINQSGKYP